MSHGGENSVDSDTSSLPDLSEIISAPPTSISRGDIVWAKFKKLYWPALVRFVYHKQKKISIWYADDPGKTFKLPLRNVCSFHDPVMRAKIEKDVREAGCIHEHEGLTSHALRYLKRRAEGYVDDPMKFFDQTYPFFVMEEWLQKNPDADVSNIKIPPLYISHESKKIVRKSVSARKGTNESEDSEALSTDSGDVSDAEAVPNDYLSKVKSHLQESISASCEDDCVDKIVECIKSGKADQHLQKILLKKIPSEHHKIYEQAIKCNKKFMSHVTYTGPIEDDEKLRELIFYLLPLYDRITSIPKRRHYSPRQCKSKGLQYPSFDQKSDGAQYVASVWLPDSIIYAISDIYNVSLSEAKQLFKEKSESKTKAVENILASVGKLFPNTSCAASNSETGEKKFVQENAQLEQHCVKHSSDIGICTPLKKLCVVKLGDSKNYAVEEIVRDPKY